ncbi:hypothetical protein NC651_032318 [Populus alba x Populus x berolinensis]|nr:hypothetical protein NC651_032318 [Populus alba x Populus x berolinensis]
MRQIHSLQTSFVFHPFTVTKCGRGKEALSMLREDKNRFDVLGNDLHMPEMDGIQLLKIIRSEMDLPVVIISSDDEQELVLKGVLQGACDCLIQPVKMEALKVLWQHVVRKKISNALERLEQPRGKEEDKLHLENSCIDSCTASGNAGHPMTLKRKINGEDEGNGGYNPQHHSSCQFPAQHLTNGPLIHCGCNSTIQCIQPKCSIGHPSLIEDYRAQGNFALHSQSLLADTMPQLNCDSLFFLQQLYQSEILQEPFLETFIDLLTSLDPSHRAGYT